MDERGTSAKYLKARIARDHPDEVKEIGKGKKYRTVHAAAVGLGSNMNVLMSLCRFHDDIEAVDLLSKVDAGKEGNPTGKNQYNSGTVDNINSSTKADRPTGTSAAATMRRLSKDFPLIHERVLSGELSPNKAALEAGFRQPKLQLPADAAVAGRYLASRVDNE